MIIELRVEVDEDELKRCIVASSITRYGNESNVAVADIRNFAINDTLDMRDIENMLLGSSFGELIRNCNIVMKIVQ